MDEIENVGGEVVGMVEETTTEDLIVKALEIMMPYKPKSVSIDFELKTLGVEF